MASAAGVWPWVRSMPQCWYIPAKLRRLERYCNFDRYPGTAFTEVKKSSNALNKVIFVLFSEIGTKTAACRKPATLAHAAGARTEIRLVFCMPGTLRARRIFRNDKTCY